MAEVSILALLLRHPDKNLRRHVLSYAYRKANVIARSCRAGAALIADPAYWRYGVQQELRKFLLAEKVPLEGVEKGISVFDPFFNAWPADMPAVYYAPYGHMLSWIWDRNLIRMARVPHQVEGYGFWIRDRRGYHRWTWNWTSDTTHTWEFIVTHIWTQSRFDIEGDHWYGPNNGNIMHKYQMFRTDGVHVSAQMDDTLFWLKGRARGGFNMGMHFRGYCDSRGEPLHGINGWVE